MEIEPGFDAPIAVEWSTDPGTAGNDDYIPAAGELTFGPDGPWSHTITVQTVGDCEVEADETFYVVLMGNHSEGGDPGAIVDGEGLGLIGDAPCMADFPEITVLDKTVELVDDVSTVDFGMTTPGIPLSRTFTVQNLGAGTLTLSGLSSNSGAFTITQDFQSTSLLPEQSTTFAVTFNASTVGNYTGTITFSNNDGPDTSGDQRHENPFAFNVSAQVMSAPAQRTITINDVPSILEGNMATFTVQLSSAPLAGEQVTVAFATADGNPPRRAMGEGDCLDYYAASGTLTFLPGQVAQQITIVTRQDPLPEEAEDFFVNLSDPSGAVIGDGQGLGTILANDGPIDNGLQLLVTAPDAGSIVNIRLFDGSDFHDLPEAEFPAYDPEFQGGVRVATGDINGDGMPDVITGPGPNGGPHVRVFDGATFAPMNELNFGNGFFAFDSNTPHGVFVASGDVNGDGREDIIVSLDAGGLPSVRVFSGATGTLLHEFLAYHQAVTFGVRVASADVDGDGYADIMTGPGPGGGPHVKVFSGATGAELFGYFAYDPNYPNGVYVAAGDLNHDGRADLVTGAGSGGGPHVVVRSGANYTQTLSDFFAYHPDVSYGVRVGIGDTGGTGDNQIITAPGPGGGAHVRIFDPQPHGLLLCGAFLYPPGMDQGVFPAGVPSPLITGASLEYFDTETSAWIFVPEGEEAWDSEELRWTIEHGSLASPIVQTDWYAKLWDSRLDDNVPWTHFAMASSELPAIGNPGVGVWAIRVEASLQNGAVAQLQQPRQQTIAAIVDILWEGVPLSDGTNLDDNPPDMGGGLRFFPGKNTATGPEHRTVNVRVNVMPAQLNLRVYLRIVDADDPTDANGPIDNDAVHSLIGDKDNLGSGESLTGTTLITSQIVAGQATGTRTFTTSLNPGDNFRIVAAPRTTGLANYKPLYSHAAPETLGRLYYDADRDFVLDANEPILDETSIHQGAHVSRLLTLWRRLHVEVDSMGGSGGVNLGEDDPQTADVPNPDTTALAAAFRPAFIDVQILEPAPDGPNNGNTPFRPSFINLTDMDDYFLLGPNPQRGTRNEDSMFWTVYIAGIYEMFTDGVRDNDPDDDPDPNALSSVLGFTRAGEPQYSVVAMEVIRDVAIEHNWTQAQVSHVQQAVVVHEIGHHFELPDDNTSPFPSHIMRHPTLEAHDPLTPGITIEFTEAHVKLIREHGSPAKPRP